jgi:hypothetical protein
LAASCRAKSAAIRRQFNFMGETIEPQLARQIGDVLFKTPLSETSDEYEAFQFM